MGGAGVVVRNAIVTSCGLDQVEHGLELTDVRHVPENAEKVLLGETAALDLFLDGLVVLHHRDDREFEFVFLGTQGDFWIYVKCFRHGQFLLFDCECGFLDDF